MGPLTLQKRTCGLAIDPLVLSMIQALKVEHRIMHYELSDCEWGVIKPMLPNKPRGIPRGDDRRVLNGIFWIPRSGAPWRRDLRLSHDLLQSLHSLTQSGCLGSADGGGHCRPRCRCADDRQLTRAGTSACREHKRKRGRSPQLNALADGYWARIRARASAIRAEVRERRVTGEIATMAEEERQSGERVRELYRDARNTDAPLLELWLTSRLAGC
jgi:transposase